MFVTAPFVAVPPGENPAEHRRRPGRAHSGWSLDRAPLTGRASSTRRRLLAYGVRSGWPQTLPMKLVLADSHLGLVPLTVEPDGEPGAVLLQRSGLLAAIDALFETTWRRAYPLDCP